MPTTEVVFYRDEDGSVPVLQWLDDLPLKARLKCLIRLERLRELGHELRRPEADLLRDGVYELRIALNRIQYRVLYGFQSETTGEEKVRRPAAEKRKPKEGAGGREGRKDQAARRTIAVLAHGLTKEGRVPDEEIDRAALRLNKFRSNPGRHTYTEH